jgi:hypothetical protein
MHRNLFVQGFLFMALATAPSYASVIRLTISGTVGAPAVTAGTPPIGQGMDFLLRFEVDLSSPTAVSPGVQLYYAGNPLYQSFIGSSIPAGTISSSVQIGTFGNLAITTALQPNGNDRMVFGPIPWNFDTTTPVFTPGTSSLSVGLLDLVGPSTFNSGITRGVLVVEEVPEPATGVLLGLAGLGILAGRRRL